MEVILRSDVPKVGKAGELIKVSEGFARNFLLPRKKAVVATEASKRTLENEKKGIEAKREKVRGESQALSQKIEGVTVVLEKQAGEENKIFGSVTTKDIAQGLQAQGITIDKRSVRLKEPLRVVGDHVVEIHLSSDVTASLKVQIVKK